ncbi:hypothetical protein E8E12_011158 [Didymella heteroderae]|uniref:Uncharacterized protein n=1 Tax=Didymella heteroderae TaxID=1769908 RepID=A0A9P4X268_9PLEO|nr:hypothetical protein E8E12_011158 [Didymella heteroderae]
MHLASILTIAPIFFLASASPLEIRQDTLQPFNVTSSWSESPPGRPGSSPWRLIRASAIDPNSYTLKRGSFNYTVPGGSQGLNCVARWYRGESPQGRTWPCDSIADGHWALQVLPGSSGDTTYTAISDYKLKFIHAVEPGMSFENERYEAEVSLQTGVNLIGRCSSGGVCNYVLGAEYKPLLAPAVKVL